MTYSSEVLADSPRGYWRLGETSGTTAVDSASGGGHPGTYGGTFTLGTTGLLSGDTDKALTLNAAGWVTIPETVDLTAFTVEGWYKGTTATFNLVSRRHGLTGSTSRSFWIGGQSGSATVLILRGTGGTFTSVTSSDLITDNLRHHLAGTYDGTTLRLYLDGREVGTPSTAVSGPLNTDDNALVIGGQQTSSGSDAITPNLAGVVDEVAFYTTALSASRIAAHFAAGAGTVPVRVSRAAAYTMVRPATPAVRVDRAASYALVQPAPIQVRIDRLSAYTLIALQPKPVRIDRIAAYVLIKLAATVRWWDGSNLQAAEVLGWWDGSAIQPLTTLGWWDGSSIQPLA